MALTRKMLKGMGLTEEQADTIIEAHTEVTDGLKDKLKAAEEKVSDYDALQKKVEAYEAKGSDGYEEKFKKLQKDFEAYKADITAKETKAAREAAAKAFFESKHITGANLAIAMRGARDEIAELELDSDGKIKDGSKLEGLVKGEFASLIVTESTRGASTTTPPTNTGGGGKMTKEQIMAIKDIGQRQAAIAENHELFGF
jgi:plasmid maintenance system antidote protein VapI